MIEIKRYTTKDATEWDAFVKKSRQGTFLFFRNYMDYHQDRFRDHSLMFFHKNKLYALLPANEKQNILYSHQGLTYGGLLTSPKVTAAIAIEMVKALQDYLRANGFRSCIYKAMPWIYQAIPSEEDLYALSHIGKLQFLAREISTTIALNHSIRFSEQRRRGIKKAKANALTIRQASPDDVATFWEILNENLIERHHTRPVHSKEELLLLMSRFPENIEGYVVLRGAEIIGGTIIYITPQVIHTQYIAASETGREIGALDLLFDYIIQQHKWNALYIDFGKSTENCGKYLNTNLIHQKEGFGGRGVIYDTYEWDI